MNVTKEFLYSVRCFKRKEKFCETYFTTVYTVNKYRVFVSFLSTTAINELLFRSQRVSSLMLAPVTSVSSIRLCRTVGFQTLGHVFFTYRRLFHSAASDEASA